MLAGLKKDAQERVGEALSDADIRGHLPEAKILKYSELSKSATLFDVLPLVRDYCFILYEDSVNRGHWTVISRPEDGVVEYFDSYGGPVDAPLRWTCRERRVGLGEGRPWLSILLEDALRDELVDSVVYNKRKYQSDSHAVANCGRWCVLRTLKMLEGFDLDEFSKFVTARCRQLRMNPDECVTTLIV